MIQNLATRSTRAKCVSKTPYRFFLTDCSQIFTVLLIALQSLFVERFKTVLQATLEAMTKNM